MAEAKTPLANSTTAMHLPSATGQTFHRLISEAIRANTPYSDLAVLPVSDRRTLEKIVEECDAKLVGLSNSDIGAMYATLMTAYENHGLTDKGKLRAKQEISMQMLAEVPSWLIGTATLEAMRATARSPNERDRIFMPSDAMILAEALPVIDQIKAERLMAQKLIRRGEDAK